MKCYFEFTQTDHFKLLITINGVFIVPQSKPFETTVTCKLPYADSLQYRDTLWKLNSIKMDLRK